MLSFRLVICSAVLAAKVAVASNSREESMPAGVCSGAGANPWVYNFAVNGFPAKVLNDATNIFPLEGGFLAEDPAVLKRALKRRFLNDTAVFFDNNILYVNWDGEGVLFDCGTGPGEAPSRASGMLFEHLGNDGIARDSIKHVLITHAHSDHIQGLVEDLESLIPAYPRAKVYMSRVEYEYWTAETVRHCCVCAIPLSLQRFSKVSQLPCWYSVVLILGSRECSPVILLVEGLLPRSTTVPLKHLKGH
jgi:hypothetical protein